MPLPLTVSCFSKIQIGFTFQILAHPGSPRKRAVKRVCVCMCVIGVVAAIQSVTTTTMNKLFCIKADLCVCVCVFVSVAQFLVQCTATVFSIPGPNFTCGTLISCGWSRQGFCRGTARAVSTSGPVNYLFMQEQQAPQMRMDCTPSQSWLTVYSYC